jgi:hypothetical protein
MYMVYVYGKVKQSVQDLKSQQKKRTLEGVEGKCVRHD